MNLTINQRAILSRRGILVCIEYASGVAKCITPQGERIYTINDLRTMATPSAVERLRSWIAGVAA